MAVETRGEPAAAPDRETLLALYRVMLTIRLTEEGLARLHQQGLVHGACHTYVGEEAIATGVCSHLRPDDTLFSTHRGHGHALAKGVTPHQLMAELLGRETGCAHGRGGSMHLFQPEIGLLGTSGIVGPSMLLASGSAYAFRLNKTDRVSVAFFGDGASNNGAFHEGINMATVWKLPVLFVCENNEFATEGPGRLGPGRRARPAGRDGRRQRRPGRPRGRRRGGSPGAGRRRADADRVQDVPLPGPHLR